MRQLINHWSTDVTLADISLQHKIAVANISPLKHAIAVADTSLEHDIAAAG
jgi:hypothetical protein